VQVYGSLVRSISLAQRGARAKKKGDVMGWERAGTNVGPGKSRGFMDHGGGDAGGGKKRL